MGTPITAVQWTHACYVKNDVENVMVVKEKHITIDSDTREIIDVKNRLTHSDPDMVNPKRTVYVTKPEYRTHVGKKETEEISHLDMYILDDRNLIEELKPIMGMNPYSRIKPRQMYNSPYIYNADVSMEKLIRSKYIKNLKHPINTFTFGALDIESSVLGDEQINIFSFIHENEIYTAVLDEFLYKIVDGKRIKADVTDIRESIAKYVGKLDDNQLTISYMHPTKKEPTTKTYTLNIEVFPNEKDLIIWVFRQIHRCETDFIGIWNINYDIPQIVKRLAVYGITPEQIFCHPSVPKSRKYFRYHEDKKKTQHIADKWHWLHCTAMTQYLDMMLLYARIRKAKRKKSSYKLDAIAKEELGMGKLHGDDTNENMDHYIWQRDKFCDYVAYNIVDDILLCLLEEKNHDILGMWNLTEDSPLSDFSKQSIMLKDGYYNFATENDRAYATTGENMVGPFDCLLPKVGGAVLPASRCKDIGTYCLVERPDYETSILAFVSDLDFKAIYPSFKSGFGISKETKIATIVAIEGKTNDSIEPLAGAIANPHENAVWLGSSYFGLPDYNQMLTLSNEYFVKR